MPKRRISSFPIALLAAAVLLGACGGEEGGEIPPMLRTRFETEMKTILREVKAAQETAAALEGVYLELDRLQGRFFTRPVPETYDLSLGDVSADGFTARIEHRATGLSCRLQVGGGGAGVPSCR